MVHLERLRIGRAESETRPLDIEAFLAALVHGLAHGLAGVRQLEIAGVPMQATGVQRLCAAESARHWRRLALERADLKDAGAKALAAVMTLANIEDLWLRENGITADGLCALVDAPGLRRVGDLDMGRNTIDEPGMKAILERKSMKDLARLGLEESVHHRVFADWTDWTGANIGGDYETQTMEPKEVAEKYPLPGVLLYKQRHE